MSAYSTALRALSERLDSDLALLRQREHTEALSVVEAATERCRILQRHLDACRELRSQHLQGFTDPYVGHEDPYQELHSSIADSRRCQRCRQDGQMRDLLEAWRPLEVVGVLGGGNRNTVMEAQLGARRVVVRQSRRPPASLAWEADLLDHLSRNGLRVPAVVPALDGRRHIDGVMVQTWLDGTPPGTADWPAVTAFLRRLHQITATWPQRPGSASTRDLLTAERGGDVDLSAMPADAVADCRRAWARMHGSPQAVVHGDPGPANIRMSADGAGLLDWDEARVDYTDLDLAELPGSELPLPRLTLAREAATAWETANGWIIEPSYAQHQLELLRSGRQGFG